MVGRNSAALIAQIGQMTRPKVTEGKSIDIAGAVDAYFRGKEIAEKQKQKQNLENLTTALQGGNEEEINQAYAKADPIGYNTYLQNLKQANLEREQAIADEELKHQRALELQERRNTGLNALKGEFGSLLAHKATLSPDDPQHELIDTRLRTIAQSPEYVQERAYSQQIGKEEAKKQGNVEQSITLAGNEINTLDNLVSELDANPDLVGVYSPYKTMAGRLTGGALGYSESDLEKRGSLIRGIGEVQNQILAKARASGQSGINTISEIQQATKGIDENSSYKELRGALMKMRKSAEDLQNRLNKSSTKQDNLNPRIQQALDAGYSMEEINAYLGR